MKTNKERKISMNLYLPESIVERIEKQAEKDGLTRSAYIERLVTEKK